MVGRGARLTSVEVLEKFEKKEAVQVGLIKAIRGLKKCIEDTI